MTFYEVGDTLAWGVSVTDVAGAPADPTTGPTALVTLPGGSTTAALVTKTATGRFTATLVAAAVGRHVIAWSASGANSAGFPHTDHADVVDGTRLIIPMADARAALGLQANNTAGDDALRLLVAAATQIIEDEIGPVLVRPVTVTVSGGGSPAIPLDAYPSAVTSVTENGTTLTEGTDFCWDEFGLLWRGSSQRSGRWSSAAPRNVAVTYTVGAAAVEPAVIAAGKDLVKWLNTRQQVPRAAPGSSPGTSWTPSGFAVPNAVKEMLAPFQAGRTPGMA